MAHDPLVTFEEVGKSYGPRRALEGLSLELHAGEILALLGPNGAGKTTALKCLLGLVRPDTGRIRVGGLDVRRNGPAARARIGCVPQRTEPGDGTTGRDLLRYVARLRGLGPDEVARAAGDADAGALLEQPMATLSGGQFQRVVLAQALIGDPVVLVLDEPTVSLDPLAQHDYVELLGELRGRGKGILLSSHLLSEVERIADRALVLEAGRPRALWSRDAWAECGLDQLFLGALGRPQGIPGAA